MASGKTEWPQSLKDFANRCFSNASDANRAMVQEELRALIYKCYTQGTIETTDWASMQLESLGGGKAASSSSSSSASSKKPITSLAVGVSASKAKKRPALDASQEPPLGLSFAERERREKRAKRFDRDKAEFDKEEQRGVLDPSEVGNDMASGYGSAAMRDHTGVGFYYDTRGNTSNGAPAKLAERMSLGGMPPPLLGASSRNGRAAHLDGPAKASKKAQVASGINAAVFADTVDASDPNVVDWDQDTVVGLSTKIEKPYLRLTSAPDPRNVRTLPTLMQTLEFLKKKWRTENNYNYICDQFKSMRQDLTVQRIKNDFTVKVYEIHARIALEKGDLGEYNQCQSQLRGLYALGIKGSVMEFLAYRILYLLHTRNRRDVNSLMTELEPRHKMEQAVAHALNVRSALATGNYHAFFRLYDDAPNMNAYIMDHFIIRERISALYIMSKTFRPSVPLTFISTELSFADVDEAHEFLCKHGAAEYVMPASSVPLSNASAKSKRNTAAPKLPKLSERSWDAKAAQRSLEDARVRLKAVDIKGQI